jgi:rsbT antagonist protein RsbS
MRSPILKQGKFLIASLQGSLSDADLLLLRDELIQKVQAHRSTGVIVDVTVLDVLDSFAARTLRAITQMTRLLGAHSIIVGIQPEVAFAMAQLGLNLDGATTALDLEGAIALLSARDRRGSLRNGR